jgi:very-short-patch-repair endonuclease
MPYRKQMPKSKTDFARQMRRRPTRSEAMVWERIRMNALGVRARQQVPMLGWIADFYIPAWKLVVEIDGSVHDGQRRADARRDHVMEQNGLRVLRIPAADVYADPDAVVDRIKQQQTQVLRLG